MVWWDQDKRIWFRSCQACVVVTRWGVQRQVCLTYSQSWWWECHVWGCMSAAGTGELQFIEGTMNANIFCDMTYSNMITTTALLKKLRVKVMDWPSMFPDLNPIEHLWGILKQKVEERKVSKIHQLMSSWSGRGLHWQHVKLWWSPCPRGLRQCWKIMVATQNIDTLGPIWTF